MATEVIAVTPVRNVSSGSGWKRLVCRPGASLPAAWAAANFAAGGTCGTRPLYELRLGLPLPHDGALENGESGDDRVEPAVGGLQAG
jgi:hypothetical protein